MDNFVLSGKKFHGLGSLSGDSLDFKEDEEEKFKNVEDHNLDWISQGSLILPSILHRIPIHLEKFLMKYDPNKETKA